MSSVSKSVRVEDVDDRESEQVEKQLRKDVEDDSE